MADLKTKTGKSGTSAGVDKTRAGEGGKAKRTPGKTAPAIKKSAAQVSKRESAGEREALAKELRGLIPRLDAEGLSFLIEQAQVHLYNMQVEELNRTLSRAKPGSPKRSAASADTFRIEGTESGSSYYLIYNNEWIMFSREEMIRLVGIVSAEGTDLEIRDRLFTWFEKERRDVLSSIAMADKFDQRLKKLAALIKKTFKVRYR
jgi:hypothetical protein